MHRTYQPLELPCSDPYKVSASGALWGYIDVSLSPFFSGRSYLKTRMLTFRTVVVVLVFRSRLRQATVLATIVKNPFQLCYLTECSSDGSYISDSCSRIVIFSDILTIFCDVSCRDFVSLVHVGIDEGCELNCCEFDERLPEIVSSCTQVILSFGWCFGIIATVTPFAIR